MKFLAGLASVVATLALLLPVRAQAPAPSPSPSPSASPTTPPASPSAQPSATPRPPLVANPAAADHLYPGGMATIAIANAGAPLGATIDNPIATWTFDQSRNTVVLAAGQTLGRATLTITDAAGATIQIPVRVGIDAGRLLSPSVPLHITGNPLSLAWLQQIAQKMLARNVALQPGAPAPQIFFTTPLNAIAPGVSAAVLASVQIAGTDRYYAVNSPVNVDLKNVASAVYAPPLLFYDDDPERISDFGVLFRGTATAAAPVRLYYYHQNTLQPRVLKIVLNATQPSTVQLIDASAGPNIDVMTVGHKVSHDFLQLKPANEGLIVELAAGLPYVVDDVSLAVLDGAAGSLGIRILDGGPVDAAVLSVPPGTPDAALPQLVSQPRMNGDGHHRTGVFDIAGYPPAAALDYSVGGEDVSMEYGDQSPPLAEGTQGHDYGEYGVWRTITFSVDNPTSQPANVYLFERPMGGVVRSSFVIDGNSDPVSVPCARMPEKYAIGGPMQAVPGKSTIQIQTMTDGGSNYPIEVGMTGSPPATPPPITAPDGCFPKPVSSPQPAPEPTGRFAKTRVSEFRGTHQRTEDRLAREIAQRDRRRALLVRRLESAHR